MRFITNKRLIVRELKIKENIFWLVKTDNGFTTLKKVNCTFGYLTKRLTRFYNTLQELENVLPKNFK
jgi:hypothetical protein